MSFSKIMTSLFFFRYMANLEQSGSWIPDTDFVKVLFS